MSTSTPSGSPAIADLVFVAFNSRAAALDRETGELVWKWRSPRGYGPVALMLDGDRVIASVQGYTYCIDAATGRQLWQNDMKGFGIGIPCLTSFRSSSMATSMLAQHEESQNTSNTSAST
ncbi:MAG: PQQ-binding-like beta-propeller repeat protein [Planctomycetota bacterium]